MKRGFWEYKEPDGTVTNFRAKWLVGAVIVGASLGILVTLLAGCAAWLAIPAGAALTATGTLIAFTIDYMHDNRSGGPGNDS